MKWRMETSLCFGVRCRSIYETTECEWPDVATCVEKPVDKTRCEEAGCALEARVIRKSSMLHSRGTHGCRAILLFDVTGPREEMGPVGPE